MDTESFIARSKEEEEKCGCKNQEFILSEMLSEILNAIFILYFNVSTIQFT